MKVNIRAHHVEVTPALKEYAQKKMEKLETFFENIQEINVEMDFADTVDENKRQRVTATVWASGTILRAKEASKSMYAAIDVIFEKLEKQLRKYKEKLKTHHKKNTLRRSVAYNPNPKNNSKRLVSPNTEEKLLATKPMDPEDAAEILEMEKQDFLVFRNIHTEEVNVVYTIGKGEFGLIEP